MTFILTLLAALLIFLVSVTVILLLVGPVMLLQPRRRDADFYRALGFPTSPAELGLPWEEFTITVDDGVTLSCWLIPAENARGTILYLHGVGDCKIDGLRFAKRLHAQGFTILLFDSRRHGKSTGQYCTYGYFEKFDLIRLLDHLETRADLPPGKIGIFGTSMGAAVALQAAALDRRIAAVLAENSFATLRTIFDDYQRRIIKIPFHYLRNLVIKRSEVIAHFKARDVAPLRTISEVGAPLLLTYGQDDHFISSKYSHKLFEHATAPKELYPIQGARHTDMWIIGGEAYQSKIVDFFQRTLT